MRGLLLAAGYGTRLWPLSQELAKPAFPFLGKPLIAHVAERLIGAGVQEIWVNTHHLPDTVRAAVSAQGLAANFRFVHENEILGTGGALVNLRRELTGEVIVANAKIATDIPLARQIEEHRQSDAVVTMVCVENRKREQFNHVAFDTDHHLTEIVPYARLAEVERPYVFTGIQVLSVDFFDHLPRSGFSDTVKDIYPRLIAAGRTIAVARARGSWAEFSTLRRYLELHLEATGGSGFVDPAARIEGQVSSSVVWSGAQVAAGATVVSCVVGRDVLIPAGSQFSHAVIMRADRVKAEASDKDKSGQVVGELFVAPLV